MNKAQKKVKMKPALGEQWGSPVAAVDCPVRSWRDNEDPSLFARPDFEIGCKVVYSCSRIGCTALQGGALFWSGTVGECLRDTTDQEREEAAKIGHNESQDQ